MQVTVLGATGGTGRLVVAAAREAGHEVAVLVRDRARATGLGPDVRVEVGDARDARAVARAVDGAQGVISAIGSRAPGRSTLITDCMRTVVAALPAGTRLLAVSTVGAGDSARQLPLPVRVTIGALLRNAIADHDGQEAVIMSSGLRWTIARCVGLTDDHPRGEVHVLTEGRVGGSRIPRGDVAAWLVANLSDPTWEGRAVTLW